MIACSFSEQKINIKDIESGLFTYLHIYERGWCVDEFNTYKLNQMNLLLGN